MEIWHLRYFLAVAEEGTFAAAADRLHMAASPLSRRIRDLERELGTELFVRKHHRVEPTSAGAALIPRAADVLARFDAIVAEPAGSTVTIGIAPDVSATARTAVLDAVAAVRPDAQVHLVPASTGPLLAQVRNGSLDLALTHGRVTDAGLGSHQIEVHSVYAVVAASASSAHRDEVSLSDLADLPFASISYDSAPDIYIALDKRLRRAGVHRRISVDGSNFAGVAQLVATGQAFTLAGKETPIARLLQAEPVVFLDVAEGARLSTDAVWSRSRVAAESGLSSIVDALRLLGGE